MRMQANHHLKIWRNKGCRGSHQGLLTWSRSRWGCELAGTLWWYWRMTGPEWRLPWVKRLLVAAVSGDTHTVLGFTSRNPTRFSLGKPKKDPCGQGRGRGDKSLWRCPESSLEQRLPPGGSVPELSPEDCPSLEEGLLHCNPSSFCLTWWGRRTDPSGEACGEVMAQGSATNREISSWL